MIKKKKNVGRCTIEDSVGMEKSVERKALSSAKVLFEKGVGRREHA